MNEKTPELIKNTASFLLPIFNKNNPENKHIEVVAHHKSAPIFDIIPVNGCAPNITAGSPVICSKGMLYFFPIKKANTNSNIQMQ
ncbi:hypothetical protein JYT89_02105 [Flavobacteriaceae bacterium AH-315-B10]|nr:hypothetical protein [Flavobacteriaceae bacterium AH-315-B10]